MANFGRIGGASPALVHAVLAQGEAGHKVMYALSKDLGKATQLMQMDPVRLTAAVTKFAMEVTEKSKSSTSPPPPSAPPVPPVVGGGRGAGSGSVRLDDPTVSMADCVKAREAQIKARRRA